MIKKMYFKQLTYKKRFHKTVFIAKIGTLYFQGIGKCAIALSDQSQFNFLNSQ